MQMHTKDQHKSLFVFASRLSIWNSGYNSTRKVLKNVLQSVPWKFETVSCSPKFNKVKERIIDNAISQRGAPSLM